MLQSVLKSKFLFTGCLPPAGASSLQAVSCYIHCLASASNWDSGNKELCESTTNSNCNVFCLTDYYIGPIIKVRVSVTSHRWRLRLIALTQTLIILDNRNASCNCCFIIHGHGENNDKHTVSWNKLCHCSWRSCTWHQHTTN